MLEKKLRYIGFNNQLYSFEDESGKKIGFNKVRGELVNEFQLKEKSSIQQFFKVKYFIATSDVNDIYIVSDMEPVLNS